MFKSVEDDLYDQAVDSGRSLQYVKVSRFCCSWATSLPCAHPAAAAVSTSGPATMHLTFQLSLPPC